MADKDVKIDIRTSADTSGAKQAAVALDQVADEGKAAAGSLESMENHLRRLQDELRRLPVGSAEFKAMADKVKVASKNLADTEREATKLAGTIGRRGNAGMAVLELSRAFEDAQYGIRGVLNNIPGLIAMLGGSAGLAGVISVVAVIGAQLWEKFGKGAKKATDDTKEFKEKFAELLDVYEEFASAENEERMKRAVERAADVIKKISKIEFKAEVDTSNAKTQDLKEAAENRLALQQKQNDLAKLESLAKVSGEEAAKEIAEHRARIAREIIALERAEEERKRKALETAGEIKVGKAQQTFDERKQADADAAGEADRVRREMQALRDQAKALTDARAFEIRQRVKEQQETRQLIEDIRSGKKSSGDAATDAGRVSRLESLLEWIDKRLQVLDEPSDAEANLLAAAAEKEKTLSELQKETTKTAGELTMAAKELNLAIVELRQTRERNMYDRSAESEGGMQDLDKESGDAMTNAIEALSGSSEAENPLVRDAINKIKQLATDQTADSEQGDELSGVLQFLENNLLTKDKKVIDMIRGLIKVSGDINGKYEALKDEVKNLAAKVNQKT